MSALTSINSKESSLLALYKSAQQFELSSLQSPISLDYAVFHSLYYYVGVLCNVCCISRMIFAHKKKFVDPLNFFSCFQGNQKHLLKNLFSKELWCLETEICV